MEHKHGHGARHTLVEEKTHFYWKHRRKHQEGVINENIEDNLNKNTFEDKLIYNTRREARCSILVEAMCHKAEGRGFETQ
jgi:hypothetical protein